MDSKELLIQVTTELINEKGNGKYWANQGWLGNARPWRGG